MIKSRKKTEVQKAKTKFVFKILVTSQNFQSLSCVLSKGVGSSHALSAHLSENFVSVFLFRRLFSTTFKVDKMFRRLFSTSSLFRLSKSRRLNVRHDSSHSGGSGKMRTQEEISAWVEKELQKGVRMSSFSCQHLCDLTSFCLPVILPINLYLWYSVQNILLT